jgi:nitroreductase
VSAADSPVPMGEDAPVFEVMATMRAMRRLKPDPVPDALLTRLVEAATWAPSGSNMQAYSFVVVTDRSQMARLADLWRSCVDLYLGSVGAQSPSTMDDDGWLRVCEAIGYQRDHFHETPAVIVPCYGAPRVSTEAGRSLLTRMAPGDVLRLGTRLSRVSALNEASSIYPGVQNLLLAARALGLGANITQWHVFLEHEWKDVLDIPRDVNMYAVIPVGWPLGRFGPVVRRPAAEVVHKDRW